MISPGYRLRSSQPPHPNPNPQNDTAFSWYETGFTIQTPGYTAYMLNMTSGTWLTPNDSSRYVWTHQLLVVVPVSYNPEYASTGALWITGGDVGDSNPSETDEDVLVCASLATDTGTICSVLYQVPAQPIIFSSDPQRRSRSEDAAVAWSWLRE